MNDRELIEKLSVELQNATGEPVTVHALNRMGGGSINTSLLIRTNLGNFFAKYNDAALYPKMFETEARNLDLLRETRAIRIPGVIARFEFSGMDFLVLEFIDSGAPHYDFWSDFGRRLADIHRYTRPSFGLDYDNYIGSLPQHNPDTSSWVEFFIRHRLEPNLKIAADSGKADAGLVAKFESLYKKLPEIFPEEKPALLHGDLWSGNCMADIDGDPVIFDPGVYYGYREMDLAMSKLFGGFESEFYESYHEAFPLEKHWEHRVAICNLYPLLIHVNLFVGSYIQSVKNIVSRF